MQNWVEVGKAQDGHTMLLGDVMARSGLYILGKPGMGKSALMVNLAKQYIENEKGLFFLDPHGDAIDDFLKITTFPNKNGVYLIDFNSQYSFGINLLHCSNPTDLTAVMDTYTGAYNVFYKLWEDEWGPWLQLILQNVLWVFIENQEFTLAEIPMFLNPVYEDFRNYLLSTVKLNSACVDFWKHEFLARRERDQQARVDAALTRVNTLLTHRYVRDIIGQKETTIDFKKVVHTVQTLLIKLSANLAEDIKKFIGTVLVSELLHAVRNRNELFRTFHYCIFVDEFQNFATSDDFRAVITEGRKFGVSTVLAHQERYGQFADQQKLMGATLAAANKVFFQLTVKDAGELAPEITDVVKETEKRREAQLLPSPHAVEDVWDRGHPNQYATVIRNKYFWIVDLLKTRPNESYYAFDWSMVKPGLIENTNTFVLGDGEYHEELRTTPQMIREGLAILNKYYYDCMVNGWDDHFATETEVAIMFQAVMKLGRIFGFFPSMRIYKKPDPRHTFANIPLTERDRKYLEEFYKNTQSDQRRDTWGTLNFLTPQENPPLTELIRLAANMKVYREKNLPEYNKVHSEACKEYVAHMAIIPMQSLLGVDFQKIPYETRLPYFQRVVQQISWQISELQNFIVNCFLIIPYTLAREPIKVQSGRYDESLKFERTQQDMINEKAIELASLPRFTAYAKLLYELPPDNEQWVWTGKIQTNPLPRRDNDQYGQALANGLSLMKVRTGIEEEISKRQEKWRRIETTTPNTPPEEAPPTRF
jgi:hypothetical protein